MTEKASNGALTVGQVAERFGVTVRTLHHYDDIGLVSPHRTAAGYRVYTDDDLERLRHVVVYRRLGFPLEEIAPLLAEHADVEAHLRRQRAAVVSRLDEMRDLVAAIDRALEKRITGMALTPQEQKELFGDGFSEELAREAE
jgi:MerR family transcriptional regulator, thiopeptide resistance regulator